MRSHAFLLGSELKAVFKRWQQTNHIQILYVNRNGNIGFSRASEHKLCCHKIKGYWHVPYVSDEDFRFKMGETDKIEKMQWSCIQLVNEAISLK